MASKRLKPIDSINRFYSTCDGVYFYAGAGTGASLVRRVAFADRANTGASYTSGHDFTAPNIITDLFTDERQPGIVYAVVGDGPNDANGTKYSVWRSSDSGDNFTEEKLLGDVDGTAVDADNGFVVAAEICRVDQ